MKSKVFGIGAAAAAVMLALGLVGCSGGNQSEQKANPQPQEQQEQQEPQSVTKTDYMNIDGIYVDNSFVDKDGSPLKMVYLFYTVSTNDQNLQAYSKDMEMTVGGVNTYTSAHYASACTYMDSYYYSDFIEDVYAGSELKVVDTFKVPEADLSAGKSISFSAFRIPDIDQIEMSTDDIVFCDSVEEIAQTADPEGYAAELDKMADADEETVAQVSNAINGYWWSFYAHPFSYRIEFFAPNDFTITTSGMSNSGTYSVKKGYVVLEYPSNGETVNVPYSWEEESIDLDLTAAFSVYEN